MDNVYDKFPALKNIPETNSEEFDKITLDDLLNLGFVNYRATKRQLYRIRLMEDFAVKKKSPLLVAFKNEGKFKYAEEM